MKEGSCVWIPVKNEIAAAVWMGGRATFFPGRQKQKGCLGTTLEDGFGSYPGKGFSYSTQKREKERTH